MRVDYDILKPIVALCPMIMLIGMPESKLSIKRRWNAMPRHVQAPKNDAMDVVSVQETH